MNTMYCWIFLLVIIIIFALVCLCINTKESFDLRTDCWNMKVGCGLSCRTKNRALYAKCLKDCYKNSVIC